MSSINLITAFGVILRRLTHCPPISDTVRFKNLLAILSTVCFAGCGHNPTEITSAGKPAREQHAEHSELHAIYVDRKGYATTEELWLTGPFDTRAWHFAKRNSKDEDARIDKIIQHLQFELKNCGAVTDSMVVNKSRNTKENTKRKEILIYIHGGLNTNQASYDRTKELLGKKDFVTDCRFPIFINWRSGPFVSYKDHLIRVRQGKNGGFLAKLTSPLYLATDLAQATVGAPKAWMTQGAHNLRSHIGNRFEDYENLKPCGPNGGFICKPSANFECGSGQNNRLFRTGIWWASTPLKAAITPLVFKIGKPAWDVMLHRTNMLLWKECSLNGNCGENAPPGPNDGLGQGPLSKLIRRISDIEDLDSDYEITLVGHSMGTIVINRLVSTLPNLPIENIVFLASADSIRNTQYGALQYISAPGNLSSRFYSWMLHPDNESRELAWAGMVPSGSLLTWIDNMFSTPDSLLDYRFGRWDSVKELPEIFTERIKRQSRLLVFPQNGTDTPHEHGDFGGCNFWDLDKVESSFIAY